MSHTISTTVKGRLRLIMMVGPMGVGMRAELALIKGAGAAVLPWSLRSWCPTCGKRQKS